MLKVYRVYNYVSIDGAEWREVIWGWCDPTKTKVSDEPLDTEYLLHNTSFDDAYEYLQNNELDGLGIDTTYWKEKPIIWVRYEDAWDTVSYKRFNTISYKREYKEWTNVSIDWILKNLSADTAITYLKERGMTVCPIINTK